MASTCGWPVLVDMCICMHMCWWGGGGGGGGCVRVRVRVRVLYVSSWDTVTFVVCCCFTHASTSPLGVEVHAWAYTL